MSLHFDNVARRGGTAFPPVRGFPAIAALRFAGTLFLAAVLFLAVPGTAIADDPASPETPLVPATDPFSFWPRYFCGISPPGARAASSFALSGERLRALRPVSRDSGSAQFELSLFYGAGCTPRIIQSGSGLSVPAIYEIDENHGLRKLPLQWPVGLPSGLRFAGSMDTNGDDLPELFMVGPQADVIYLLTGDGSGRWELLQRIPAKGMPDAVAFRNLSADGWVDLVADSGPEEGLSWLNLSGVFVPVHSLLTVRESGPASFPMVPDADGAMDAQPAHATRCAAISGSSSGDASARGNAVASSPSAGRLCGDFDNDGDEDLIAFDGDSGQILWREGSGDAGSRFVFVSLFGPPQNRSGYGARVFARVSGKWQPVPIENPALANNVLPLSFRLNIGRGEAVEALRVVWPDGRRSRIPDIPLNTAIRVRHPGLAMLADGAARVAVNEAIARAEAWFASRDLSAMSFDVPLALAIMERRLPVDPGLSPVEAYQARMRVVREQGDTDVLRRMHFWRRLLTAAQARPGSEYASLPYYDPVVVPALYCDRHPLPFGYGDQLMDTARQGGYGATHALMAYWWLTDNQCPFRLSRAELAELLYRTLQTFTVVPEVNDVSIEAFTLLVATGREDALEQEQLDRLLAAQNPDGGWPMIARPGTTSNGHTTVLAYWGLQLLRHFNQVQQPAVVGDRAVSTSGPP